MTQTQVAVIEADSVIVSMKRASTALAEAKTIQQTKKILDVAHAAEIYAKRQRLGEEATDLATAIKVEALRKLGEMLQTAPKNKGVEGKAGPGRGKPGAQVEPGFSEPRTLAELGLTKKESAVAQKLAALPEKDFEQVREGNVTVAKAIAAVNQTKPPATTAPPPPPPVPEEFADVDVDAAMSDIDPMEEVKRLQADNRQLEEQLKALQVDDTKAELAKQIKMRQALEGRLGFEMEKVNQLQRELDGYGKWYAELRKITGKDRRSEITRIVKAARAEA